MRDNLNIEELSNQAWHKMSVKLDQEMPVQDGRKKRPFFWWLFGAGILLTVLVALFQWSNNATLPEPQIKSLPIPLRTVAGNNVIETKSEEEHTIKTIDNEASTNFLKTNENKVTETRKPQNLKSIASTKTNKVEALPIRSQRPVNSDSTLDPTLRDNTSPEVPIFQAESDKVVEVSTLESEEPTQREISETSLVKPVTISVAAVPSLSIEPFAAEELSIDEFEQHLAGKSSPFTFELGAGLISKNLDGVNGVFTELRTGLRLGKNSKFSLISGVGLHYQQEPFLIDRKRQRGNTEDAISAPTADQQGNGMNGTPIGQQEEVNSLSELVATSNIQVSSIFLDVPIALNWQFAPRLSFELGGRVSWQLPRSLSSTSSLSEHTFAQSGGGVTALDMGSRNQFSFYQPTSNNSAAVTTLTFRNWNLAATAAVNFKLNPKWTLRLQYQYGLTNRLDDSSYQMLDRMLWFGVGRRF